MNEVIREFLIETDENLGQLERRDADRTGERGLRRVALVALVAEIPAPSGS
jgi:hypothetical protein